MYNKDYSAKDNFDSFWNEVVLKKFPKAKIKYKDESNLMSFLGWFSPNFYENMTTVIGQTIYFPSKEKLEKDYPQGLRILAHEFVHLVDREQEKFGMFELKYLFPQILAMFSLLSFAAYWNIWLLLFLLFLVFLVPGIPSPCRTYFEANGYAMNLFFLFEGVPLNPTIDSKIKELSAIFVGRAYWYAARDRQLVEKMLQDRYEHYPESHEAFAEVKKWLQISVS
jgi:hypothetical protein